MSKMNGGGFSLVVFMFVCLLAPCGFVSLLLLLVFFFRVLNVRFGLPHRRRTVHRRHHRDVHKRRGCRFHRIDSDFAILVVCHFLFVCCCCIRSAEKENKAGELGFGKSAERRTGITRNAGYYSFFCVFLMGSLFLVAFRFFLLLLLLVRVFFPFLCRGDRKSGRLSTFLFPFGRKNVRFFSRVSV